MTLAGGAIAALTAVFGCGAARLGSDLQHAVRLAGGAAHGQAMAAGPGTTGGHVDEVQLTSAVLPRLNFALSAALPAEPPLAEGDRPLANNGLCPPDMASIDDRYCVDKYEGALVEVLPGGREQAWPYTMPVEGHVVRAISEKGVHPQAYISGIQAGEACRRSGKRLCKKDEWRKACKGPEPKKFGYGDTQEPGRCNDKGKSPLAAMFPHEVANGTAYTTKFMNDPMLNQLAGTVAESGSHEGCTNGYGVYDMVGNVHEWIDDPAGTFQGGYYLDVRINGDGCNYTSDAHEAWYHDYSTGFRCCADVAP